MSSFAERLNYYISDMGLTQKELAGILNISKQSMSGYTSDKTPTFAGLLDLADKLGVSLDWLCGRTDYPKWSPSVHVVRLAIRKKAAQIQAANMPLRLVAIIREIQQLYPLAREEWFMAGILGIPIRTFRAFMFGEVDVNLAMTRRFSDFTGLPEQWLMRGDPADLAQAPDLGEWIGVIEQYIRWGMTPTEVAGNAEWFYQTVLQQRRLTT